MNRSKLGFFLVAGAGKSGTTAIAQVLSSDPAVCFAGIKEPRYFVHQRGFRNGGSVYGPPHSGQFHRGPNYYSSLFKIEQEAEVYGEASTAYFYCHESPELIARYRSDARLVFVLRDPVARVISQYQHEVKVGRRLPPLSKIVATYKSPDLQRYLWGSSYGTHINRFLKYFPPSQILIISYEEFFSNTLLGYRYLREFIGCTADQDAMEWSISERVNPAGSPRFRLVTKAVKDASRLGLGRFLPPSLLQSLSAFRDRLEQGNTVSASRLTNRDGLEEQLSNVLAEELCEFKSLLEANPELNLGPRSTTPTWARLPRCPGE